MNHYFPPDLKPNIYKRWTYLKGWWKIKGWWNFLFPSQWAKVNLCACVPSHFNHVQFCEPMDYSPPGSFGHGIFQARILDWGVIPFPNELPNPGIKPRSPALQADSSSSGPPGKPPVVNKMAKWTNQRTSVATWFWNLAPWFQVSLNKILSLKATMLLKDAKISKGTIITGHQIQYNRNIKRSFDTSHP